MFEVGHHKQQSRQVIDLAKGGNRHAQKQMFELYAPKMLGVCRQYIKDMQFAEDMMITGFIKVFAKLDQFRNDGSFEGWVRRIMVNECISHLRTQKRMEMLNESEVDAWIPASIEGEMTVNEIQALIDGLPEGSKMVFNLYVIENYTHKEIAEQLGTNEGTSKSQLAYARKKLQELLHQQNQIHR
ncbi:MAG: RNA polymerase sigma factor [Saprospiraceae bacterium]|nr:RNA polymerase sigma factor [Saprospiraceae bacterium]